MFLVGRPAGQISFPVDFFEHAQQTNDVDFGGNDVLQIYNTNQIKHRLNTTGMYIASTKVNLRLFLTAPWNLKRRTFSQHTRGSVEVVFTW